MDMAHVKVGCQKYFYIVKNVTPIQNALKMAKDRLKTQKQETQAEEKDTLEVNQTKRKRVGRLEKKRARKRLF